MRYALALLLVGCASTSSTIEVSTIHEVSPSVSSECDPLDWPVHAPVASGFGPRSDHPHQGIDLLVPEGTRVVAACEGTVAFAGVQRGYGRVVIIAHGDARTTLYAHNTELLVSAGEHVQRGQALARSGQTGNASTPHVHFELRDHDRAIDPVPHLAATLRLVSR